MRVAHSLNISANAARTSSTVARSRPPKRFFNRALSTTRNWSSAIWPSSPAIRQATRNGAGNPARVSGAMITVCSRAFMASRDTTTHGRVFRISAPAAGSSWTHQTSNLFIGSGFRPLPPVSIPFVRHLAKRSQFLKIAINGLLRNVPDGFVPALTRPTRLWGHDQALILDCYGRFTPEPARVQQLFRQEQAEPIADFFNLRLHPDNLRNLAPTGNRVPR